MVEDTYQSVCNDGINVFEGVADEFLAAIAVDHVKGIPEEAYHFRPTLSGFVKIARMLVIQKAVVCARDVGIIQPTDLLNEVQMRFLINGVRSPFSWVSMLWAYRKKVSQDYLPLVDGFLERTLLLIHLTAGRPACGSEILSLRHVNVAKGHHQNTFFGGGMVSTLNGTFRASKSLVVIDKEQPPVIVWCRAPQRTAFS